MLNKHGYNCELGGVHSKKDLLYDAYKTAYVPHFLVTIFVPFYYVSLLDHSQDGMCRALGILVSTFFTPFFSCFGTCAGETTKDVSDILCRNLARCFPFCCFGACSDDYERPFRSFV